MEGTLLRACPADWLVVIAEGKGITERPGYYYWLHEASAVVGATTGLDRS